MSAGLNMSTIFVLLISMISVLENRCIYVYELFKRVLFQEVYLFLSEVAPASA